MTNPIVALTSGGLDSSIMIHKLLATGHDEVYPVFFDYHQRNFIPERDALLSFLTHLRPLNLPGKLHNVTIIPLPLNFLKSPIIQQTKLSHIGELDFSQTKNNEFVPCRNILFLTFAAAFATSINSSTLAIGSHKEKLFPFPDSSMEFLDSMEQTLNKGTHNHWTILRPWEHTYKSGIITYAKEHNLPYNLTYTCYAGTIPPCGTCRACQDRQTAENESQHI